METLLETLTWWRSAMRTWTNIFKKGKTNANRHLNTRPTSCIWRKVPKFTSARARTFTFQIIIRDKILGAREKCMWNWRGCCAHEIWNIKENVQTQEEKLCVVRTRKILGPEDKRLQNCVCVFVEIMHDLISGTCEIWIARSLSYPLAKYSNTQQIQVAKTKSRAHAGWPKKTDRKDADNRKLGDAETKERHLELSARASPHRWRLTQRRGSDKLAVASGAGGGRLTHRYGSCGGRSELKRWRWCRHRKGNEDSGLAHYACQKSQTSSYQPVDVHHAVAYIMFPYGSTASNVNNVSCLIICCWCPVIKPM
jgi:hypothetical protein